MERTYLPVLLLIGFVVANAVMILGLSHYLTRHRPTPVKQEAYESGMPVLGDARERFSVKFYMVAMLFIVFDIETAFFFPLAVRFNAAPQFLFVQAIIFVAILGVAYVYVLRKGVLRWK